MSLGLELESWLTRPLWHNPHKSLTDLSVVELHYGWRRRQILTRKKNVSKKNNVWFCCIDFGLSTVTPTMLWECNVKLMEASVSLMQCLLELDRLTTFVTFRNHQSDNHIHFSDLLCTGEKVSTCFNHSPHKHIPSVVLCNTMNAFDGRLSESVSCYPHLYDSLRSTN